MSMDRPPRVPKSAPKVRLTIMSGPGAGQVVELTRCVTLIGSRAGCKLQLRSPDVAPVHAAVINTAEDVYLRDLMSRTGTYRSDLPVMLEKLEDGDTLRIADWELGVAISAYTVDTLSDLPHVTLEPEPTAFGVELNGSGQLIKLNRPVGLVGRRDGCDVTINNRHVSRAHLLLFTYAGQPVFCDLLSNNGVMLDGVRARFGVLHSGDCLDVGPQRVRMILPGVSRREPGGTGPQPMSDSVQRSASASTDVMGGSGEGTVVPLAEDNSDRIDIRAAERERR